jgi:hypothetical protein
MRSCVIIYNSKPHDTKLQDAKLHDAKLQDVEGLSNLLPARTSWAMRNSLFVPTALPAIAAEDKDREPTAARVGVATPL